MLQKLIEESQTHDQSKADFIAAAKMFHFDEQAQIIAPAELGLSSSPLELTEHALRQVCAKLGPAVYGKGSNKVLPFDYMAAIPRDLRGLSFNCHIAAGNSSRWMVRGYENTARAILDSSYPGGHNEQGDFENTQYLKIVQSFLDEGQDRHPGLRLSRSNVTADDLNMRVLWQDVPRDDGGYGLGVAVINGETGQRKLKVLPLIQRTKCDNSIMISNESSGIEFIHRGSFQAMRVQFKAAIGKMLEAAGDLLDRMIEAESEAIPDFDAVLAGITLKHNWPQPIRDSVFAGTEGARTRAAIVNGITWAAHTAIKEPNDQIEMEVIGGSMLYAPASLFEQAAKSYRRQQAGID